MIGKAMISNNCRALLRYCLRDGKSEDEKKHVEIIGGNILTDTADKISCVIEQTNQLYSKDRVKTFHIVFAHPKSDLENPWFKKIDEVDLIEGIIGELHNAGINIRDGNYVIIRHDDKPNHIDYHLIASSVAWNGKIIRDSFIGIKTAKACSEMSKKIGLAMGERAKEWVERCPRNAKKEEKKTTRKRNTRRKASIQVSKGSKPKEELVFDTQSEEKKEERKDKVYEVWKGDDIELDSFNLAETQLVVQINAEKAKEKELEENLAGNSTMRILDIAEVGLEATVAGVSLIDELVSPDVVQDEINARKDQALYNKFKRKRR